MSTKQWVAEAVALRRSSPDWSWAKLGERFGKHRETVRKYVQPILDEYETAEKIVAEQEEQEPEPKFDPRDLLPVLKVKDGETVRDMKPSDLPENIETTIPLIIFVFRAIWLARTHTGARPTLGVVVGLAGIINLFALSFGLSLGGWMILGVYAAAFVAWAFFATILLRAKLLSPALTIRKDAYDRRYYWLEKWWNWEAVKFHDGIKLDYKGRRLIYLDASEDVVRVFNAYAAPLPRLDIDPSSDEFEVTTESLADLPSMMKDVKAWVKDEEPNREIFIRQGLLVALLGGCLFAIYWAWLSLQDVLGK